MTDFTIYGETYWNRVENNARGSNGDECCACGRKAHSLRSPGLFVNLDNAPHWFGDDMGWHPIGSDCAKKAKRAGWEVKSLDELQKEAT